MADLPDYNPWAPPVFAGEQQPYENYSSPPVANLISHFAKMLGGVLMAPGNAYNSTEPVTTEQMIKPAADLAGLVTLGAGAMPAEANSLNMGIKAYHGSPHDFERFDLSKIGTGEGAQAYGHGLYFADSENVAKSYRNALSPQISPLARDYMQRNGNTGAALREFDASPYKNIMPEVRQEIETGKPSNPGKMYEVNINAEPEHFLDWDKPLSEQPDILSKLEQAGVFTGKKQFDDWNALIGPGGTYVNPADKAQRAYIAAQQAHGADAASNTFRDAGIPGIKYLDQGSRGAGEGSRNYVVFNHDLIDIMKKYAIPGMVGAPIFANADNKK